MFGLTGGFLQVVKDVPHFKAARLPIMQGAKCGTSWLPSKKVTGQNASLDGCVAQLIGQRPAFSKFDVA
jgi:hypothetical protein